MNGIWRDAGTRPLPVELIGIDCCDQAENRSGENRGPAMPKTNDLEGVQDQGGKHGGQKGMPKPEPKPPHGPDQGIVRDEMGQEQPRDKARAQQVHTTDANRR
ncbi:MAG TPA: hypothetical protein VN926_12285 [Bradyrhizobium sp.]|nr:hypothetical protein [Bradyrhizobium sp.]